MGRQPDSALIYLYRRALALVFPSKYEGFGLPVVEAMSLGCPVVCSPVASLPEVGEGAAMFVESKPKAYADAMNELCVNASLRQVMIEWGCKQAQKFSWRRCGEETIRVYRAALQE